MGKLGKNDLISPPRKIPQYAAIITNQTTKSHRISKPKTAFYLSSTRSSHTPVTIHYFRTAEVFGPVRSTTRQTVDKGVRFLCSDVTFYNNLCQSSVVFTRKPFVLHSSVASRSAAGTLAKMLFVSLDTVLVRPSRRGIRQEFLFSSVV